MLDSSVIVLYAQKILLYFSHVANY